MNSTRKSTAAVAFCVAALGSCLAAGGNQAPIQSDSPVTFPTTEKSAAEIGRLLGGSFTLIKRVEEFPEIVQKMYLSGNGVGSGMANPGEKYNGTDVADRSMPGRRLIVGRQRENLVFVNYERGGLARSMVLDILQIDSTGRLQGIWKGFCRDYKKPAGNVEEIRILISGEGCKDNNAMGKPGKK